jgi:hypothetical protein
MNQKHFNLKDKILGNREYLKISVVTNRTGDKFSRVVNSADHE